MAKNQLVVDAGKREEFKGVLSELDKARRKYDEVALREFLEYPETFNGARLSDIIEPKNPDDEDANPFAYLEFYDDEKEEVVKISTNFKFKTDTPVFFSGSKVFPIVQALSGNKEATYIKVNYKVLQEMVSKITSIKIEAIEVDTGKFEFISYKVLGFQLEE